MWGLEYDFVGSHHFVVFVVDDVTVSHVAKSLRWNHGMTENAKDLNIYGTMKVSDREQVVIPSQARKEQP